MRKEKTVTEKFFMLKCVVVVVVVDVAIVCFECSPNHLVDHGLLSLWRA